MDLRLLHPSIFRTLASSRRVDILRALAERPHTPAELARRTDVTEQTVQYHLDKLATAGLIERRKDERPWAYHELTGQGRDLVANPPSTKPLAVLAIASALLAAVAGWAWQDGQPEPLPPNSMASPAPSPWWVEPVGWAAVTLLVLGFAWMLTWLVAWRANRWLAKHVKA